MKALHGPSIGLDGVFGRYTMSIPDALEDKRRLMNSLLAAVEKLSFAIAKQNAEVSRCERAAERAIAASERRRKARRARGGRS